ncbi:hypothetical protein HZ994_16245 [Akkermansiaceae bacterium]|nr:hypothetical protein HZ994_16245 [Akkermansiaceae bacterium]
MKFSITARASEIDPRTKEHPEIDYVFTRKGKPADIQLAMVDTRVKASGYLVIWLMAPPKELFDRLSSYGHHAIQVTYPREWFGKMDKLRKEGDDDHFSGIRLEAATGEDHSKLIDIPKPDGLMERSYQFVKFLDRKHPDGNWKQFLSRDGKGLDWEKVILTGASHGSTTSARLAKEVRVARVVMLSGPRDQTEKWQGMKSATPPERFFGFTHTGDAGWGAHHYCRSWLMLGLHEFGPIVSVDDAKPPYGNSRRLISSVDVGGNADRAHSASSPGAASPKGKDGKYLYEDVWRYLYTHPVEDTGKQVPPEERCRGDFRG